LAAHHGGAPRVSALTLRIAQLPALMLRSITSAQGLNPSFAVKVFFVLDRMCMVMDCHKIVISRL
jgi:hypothetical protein